MQILLVEGKACIILVVNMVNLRARGSSGTLGNKQKAQYSVQSTPTVQGNLIAPASELTNHD